MTEQTTHSPDPRHDRANQEQEPAPVQLETSRDNTGLWPHFRRLVVFQVKLYVDALRDLVMSPLSIGAFLIDMVTGKRGEGSAFNRILGLGRQTEKAINLFDQYDKHAGDYRGIDTLIDQVEEGLRKEYRDGGVTASARDSIEGALERMRSRTGRNGRES